MGGSTPGAGAERGPGGGERGPGGRGPGRGDMRGGAAAANTVAVDGGVIDAAVAEAQTRDGEWNSISIEMPRTATAPLTLSIADGSATFASRTQLAVDTQSGEVTRWQPASTPALARRDYACGCALVTPVSSGCDGPGAGWRVVPGGAPGVDRFRARDSPRTERDASLPAGTSRRRGAGAFGSVDTTGSPTVVGRRAFRSRRLTTRLSHGQTFQ